MGTPRLCDSRRQKAPCQHCHPVLEGWWGSFKLFQTKTQKYISAITKQCPWLVPWRGWGGACWCGAFATCFPMALLLHQPPPDRVVVLAGPWAGRWEAQPPAGLLGEVEAFFFPAMESKTHAWNGSLQQRWQGSNGCPLHSGAPHLGTAACSNAYLGTAAHNAEVTPETADAAYASKARRVMPGKCWRESFSRSAVPGDPELAPGARVRQEGPEICAAAPLFSVKGRGTTSDRKANVHRGRDQRHLGGLW